MQLIYMSNVVKPKDCVIAKELDSHERVYIFEKPFYHQDNPIKLQLYETFLKLISSRHTKQIPIYFWSNFQTTIMDKLFEIKIYLQPFSENEKSMKLYQLDLSQEQYYQQLQVLEHFMISRQYHSFFRTYKKIDAGTFANVYFGERLRDNLKVAVKVFTKNETYQLNRGKDGLRNELAILKKVKGRNLNKLIAIHQTENTFYVILQLVKGVNLGTYIAKNDISCYRRKIIMKGILLGLQQLHSQNIVHRDIKPENIIYNSESFDMNDAIKIIDFGLATETYLDKYIFLRCGSPGYVAPQIINIKSNDRLNTISDIFSAGCIFYYLITKTVIFPGQSGEEIIQKNRECNIQNIIKSQFHPKQQNQLEKELLLKMLCTNPLQRITATQALQHPYFDSINLHKQSSFSMLKPLQNANNWDFSSICMDLRNHKRKKRQI